MMDCRRLNQKLGCGSIHLSTFHTIGFKTLRPRTVCSGINDFRRDLASNEPGKSNQHEPGQPLPQKPVEKMDGTVTNVSDYSGVGSVMTPYTQQRLAAAGASDIPAEYVESYIDVALEASQPPRFTFDKATSTLHFQPGFLIHLLQHLPPEFLLAGNVEKVFLGAIFAAWAVLASTVFNFFAASNLNLALVLTVNYARNKLSWKRLALIGALAWFDRLWLYWLFFVGARIDELLQRIAQPVRTVCWVFFIGWVLYLALGPITAHPLPWLPFAPGNSAFRGLGLLRIPA